MKKIIVTNIPAFYKINLYNEISKKIDVHVLFTGSNENDRNDDFVNGKIEFEYTILQGKTLHKIVQAINIVRKSCYTELILGGWDHPVLWALAFFFTRKKNALFIESSYFESVTNGVKGLVKRIFVKRISKIYASGKSQRRITDELGFKGKTIITGGVGVFNYIDQPEYRSRDAVKDFLYVGRFVEVKNLELLIKTFNLLSQFRLHLIGFGEQEELLKSIANRNVLFHGAIDNKRLPEFYQKFDVFILPSKVEPWGLVVEEALNNGMPVIVSDRVGCAEEIITDKNGLIFDYNSQDSLIAAINRISDVVFYNSLRKYISTMDFHTIEQRQINSYL